MRQARDWGGGGDDSSKSPAGGRGNGLHLHQELPGLVPEQWAEVTATPEAFPVVSPKGHYATLTKKHNGPQDPPTELFYRHKLLTIKNVCKTVCRNSVLRVNKHQSHQRVKNTMLILLKGKLGLTITTYGEIISQPERT